MGGFLPLPREWFRSDAWQEPREYSRAEAELDIRRRVAYGRHVPTGTGLALDPGDLLISYGGLARDWQWSRSRVQRFVAGLVDRGDLEPIEQTQSGTIYRSYFSDTFSETPIDTPSATPRGTRKPLKRNGFRAPTGTPNDTDSDTPTDTPTGTHLEEQSLEEQSGEQLEVGDDDCGKLKLRIPIYGDEDLILAPDDLDALQEQYPEVYDVTYTLMEWVGERRATPLTSRGALPRTQEEVWQEIHSLLSDVC